MKEVVEVRHLHGIFALIKKDISFNLLPLLAIFAALNLVMVLACFVIDDNDATDTLNYLVYTCLPSIVAVPFVYGAEDALPTRKFISALPVSLEKVIYAKQLFGIITTAVISFTALLAFDLAGKSVMLQCVMIPFILYIVMTDIFVFAFYVWDTGIARMTLIAPVVMFALCSRQLESDSSINGDMFGAGTLAAALAVSLLLTVLLNRATVRLVHGRKGEW